jgi:hypothetical protein
LQLGTLSHDTRQAPTPKKGKRDGKNRKTKEETTEDNKQIKEEQKCRERGLQKAPHLQDYMKSSR